MVQKVKAPRRKTKPVNESLRDRVELAEQGYFNERGEVFSPFVIASMLGHNA